MPTNQELRDELQSLRDEVRQLRAHLSAAVPTAKPTEARLMSRRNLLRAAPVVAAGGAIAAMSAAPAAAAVGQPLLLGKNNTAGTSITSLTGGDPSTLEPAFDVSGGINTDSITVLGVSMPGPSGESLSVSGSPNGPAVTISGGATFGGGEEIGTDVVAITGIGPGTAVKVFVQDEVDGTSGPSNGKGVTVSTQSADAVEVSTESGHALRAAVTSAGATVDAVTIGYAGTSRGLYVESTSGTNINGTITGVNDGARGIGVWGEQRGTTGAGFGVVGVGGKLGRGARLSGGAAALQLLPSTAGSHPTTGKAGDFFVDSSARLWYCQKASSGNVAATWKQLA